MLPLRFVLQAGLLLLLLLVCPRLASADERTVLLLVHGDELPREQLRDRIAAELNRPVALAGATTSADGGVVTVTYRRAKRELAVTWDGPKRGTVSRVVSAPSATDDVVRDAAMLAGNLARDESEDLVTPPPLPAPSAPATAPPAPVPPPSATETAAPNPPPKENRPHDREDVTLGVFYPFATNLGRPWVRTSFDLNLVFGRIGQLDGFQLGGLNLVARADGRGTGDASGIQIGWLANIDSGKAAGLQVGYYFNYVGKSFEGAQVSLLVNRTGGDVTGVQTALVLNTTGGAMNGLQIASLNLAGDVTGAQLGLINVGRKVNGAMIGLVNVADDVDGVPIGIASVTKSGGVHPQAWASNATLANFGVKLATKYTYTMPSAHYHHAYGLDFAGLGFTLGAHIPLSEDNRGAFVDTDLSFSWLYAADRTRRVLASGATDSYHQHLVQPRLRALFGWRFAEHFSLFAGPSLLVQARIVDEGDTALMRVGPEFVGGVEL
jgi:hypothetical protein